MESAKRGIQIKINKVVDSVLVNNRTFYWQVTLLIIIITCGRHKQHMEIINGKYEDNYFCNKPNGTNEKYMWVGVFWSPEIHVLFCCGLVRFQLLSGILCTLILYIHVYAWVCTQKYHHSNVSPFL